MTTDNFGNNQVPTYTPTTNAQGTEEQQKERAQICRKLLFPSILYALTYTILLYKNYSSITMPVFIVATLGYFYYMTKTLHTIAIKTCIPYATGMLILGISTCFTDSAMLHILNFLGIVVLLICMSFQQYCDVKNWTIVKYLSAFGLLIGGIFGTLVDELFSDIGCYYKKHRNTKNQKVGYVLLGIAISIPFLIFVTILFCSADAVFSEVVSKIFDSVFDMGDIVGVFIVFLLVFLVSYCSARFMNQKKISESIPDFRRHEPLIGNTILGLTSVLYLFFSGIQIVSLFLGKMDLPKGYTYAQYAREGFFQLLFVSLMNIFLVLFFVEFFKDNQLMKILLTVICACTYIMIASSALRMCMYISAYRLTFLRIFVLWFLAVLAVVLSGVIIQIYKRSFPLFRYILLVVSVFYISFSFAHPDYWIAKYNLNHPTQNMGTYAVDDNYLQNLSADAAPAIAECDEKWAEEYKKEFLKEYDKNPLKFNFSTWYAYHLFKK